MTKNDAGRFIAKALFLGVLFYGISFLLSSVFARESNWRAWQDPRKRLLYETVSNKNDIILLGDSIWISSYVKSEEETLWKGLERLTGKPVFNATLNGADPPDFLNAVKLFPKREGRQSVAFLDVVPTRLLHRNFAEPVKGNYVGEFSQLVADNPLERVVVRLRKPLLIFNEEIVMNCLLRKTYFSIGDDRYREWENDGDFALKRFRTFERYIADTDELKPVDWITAVHGDLGRKGYRLIVVVTPVNQYLIRAYASPRESEMYLARIGRAHRVLVEFLQQHRIEYVDCFDEAESDDFADLIHTNERGDERIAEKMADYLRIHQQGTTAEKEHSD